MKFGFLIKHFPPEKFLDPPRIGISFSDSNIKAIFFDKETKNPQLQSAILSLEKGAIVNGSISDMNEVVKKLSVIKRDFKSPFAFFTLPDELAYVFTTTVAVASGSSATESVAFIIEENVPTALVDTVFDFVPTEIKKTENGYDAEVVVVASLKKEVNKFLEAMRLGGFEPLGCIHESQAIANSLLTEKELGLICIVHARENRIGIYLV
jgi:Tfp pilus assembly PilM family ATPase